MATFEKRKDSWRVQVCVKGIRESATFDTKTEAKAWAATREHELRLEADGKAKEYTLQDAMLRYRDTVSVKRKGEKWERDRIAKFMRDNPRLVKRKIASITSDDLGKWRDARLDEVSPASVRREANLWSAIFTVARQEWKWIAKNPWSDVRMPPKPKPRDRRISDDEIKRLCLAASYEPYNPPKNNTQQVVVAFLLAIETGMRSGEILKLDWQHTHLDERYTQLFDTKNSDNRDVPLSTAAIKLLEAMQGINDGLVFTVKNGSFQTLFKKLKQRCEIENLHFHDTRHEACTRLAKKLPIEDLARMLGHRRLDSIMIYYNATAQEIAHQLD